MSVRHGTAHGSFVVARKERSPRVKKVISPRGTLIMNVDSLERHFERIGARIKLRETRARSQTVPLSINIGSDREGEFFDLSVVPRETPPELLVLNIEPDWRHLLLMSRDEAGKHKFLCGHDERHWFVAAVPENRAVSTVKSAFEALRPAGVTSELVRHQVRTQDRRRRRTEAFVRQGEWFFVPAPGLVFPRLLVLHDEPISRGRGKPHLCENLVRAGGETVYVCRQFPQGLTEDKYRKLISIEPDQASLAWQVRRRDASVFVRGRVRHSDHATIRLDGWHRVWMNTENESQAMSQVAFLD